jgi:branched-chain amino acid transport system substrate-binding protein
VLFRSTGVFAQPAEKPPIKMGVLLAFTGPIATVGKRNFQGIQVGFEKRDYKVGDRRVELIVEDEEGKPDVALMKAKKLVEKDKVSVIFGPTSSASGYAIKEYLRAAKVPLLMSNPSAPGLTNKNFSPYVFRVYGGNIGTYYAAKWTVEKMGCRKSIFMAVDYAHGRETAEAFTKGFKRAGGTVVGEIYTALGTKDYGPYLTRMAKIAEDTAADCLGITYAGTDAIAFVRQLDEYGLKGKFRLVIGSVSCTYGTTLSGEGKAAIGIYDITPYYHRYDHPENIEFVERFEKKFGRENFEALAANGYLVVDLVYRALDTVKGNIEEQDRFLEALRNIKFHSLFGPFEFDRRDQNMRGNYKILRNEMVGNKLDQVLVHEFLRTEDWFWVEDP